LPIVTAFATVSDKVLETSVVGSFSKIGFNVRSSLERWQQPVSMLHKTVLITGATSGIGLEAATQMATLGATVHFLARSESKARRVQTAIVAASGNNNVEFTVTDLSDIDGVRRTAATLAKELEVLHVLVHNAGALSRTYEVASNGSEMTIASQLLGPFLLTNLLMPLLERASPGKVLTVSSGGMYTQRLDVNQLEMNRDNYKGVTAYARAKRAQVVLTHEWARRVGRANVVFHSLHPGWVDTPGVRTSMPKFHRLMRPLLRTPPQGADTIVWLAASPQSEESSGDFWLDRRRRSEYKVPWTVPRNASDDQLQLWQWCDSRRSMN
jgi:NAD(P)-dependent dehydrogenase (short-subunit alcohol dehydrogenase family)